uniref:Ionotropic receptor IR36 n=1 Tax=Lobesia botrana TaxID=209534 RepID=A0A345BF43_9NEOP|nr:ionotropic receptor IR36 [Lobesia botrana]
MVPDMSGVSMKNYTFTILVEMVEPFTYLKESATSLEGNDRYEGFAIDLFEKLADDLGFICDFKVTNLSYGGWKDSINQSYGVVREIEQGR